MEALKHFPHGQTTPFTRWGHTRPGRAVFAITIRKALKVATNTKVLPREVIKSALLQNG